MAAEKQAAEKQADQSRTDDKRSVEAAGGWNVLLPPGWVTLPTEPEASRRAIAGLLDTFLAGRSRDELIDARVELDRMLRRQAADAAKAGADYVHALMKPIRGLPVSASMMAVAVPTLDPDAVASAISTVLGSGEGVVENGHAELSSGLPALRRVRQERTSLDGAPDSAQVVGTWVDYVIPIADDKLLVVVLGTTSEQVHRELVFLFDAIVDSLHPAPGHVSTSA